jgi:hypothetical protein
MDESNIRQTVQVARLLARFIDVSCIHTRPDESSVPPTFAPPSMNRHNRKGEHMTRKKALLMGLVGLIIISAGSLPSATTTITVGVNVNITRENGSQAEGTIAVNPTNPLEVFAAHNPPNTAFSPRPAATKWRRGTTSAICSSSTSTPRSTPSRCI